MCFVIYFFVCKQKTAYEVRISDLSSDVFSSDLYLLVGAALATFYVVLLALSEQIGFGPAYTLAAVAVAVLVGGYAMAVLRARRAGLLLGGVLGVINAIDRKSTRLNSSH